MSFSDDFLNVSALRTTNMMWRKWIQIANTSGRCRKYFQYDGVRGEGGSTYAEMYCGSRRSDGIELSFAWLSGVGYVNRTRALAWARSPVRDGRMECISSLTPPVATAGPLAGARNARHMRYFAPG